jgi:radical SAM superfamily enzyme YgiQ (UPF0313 family)
MSKDKLTLIKNIFIINLVRDLYWDDRENLNLQLLAATLINNHMNCELVSVKYSNLQSGFINFVENISPKNRDILVLNIDFYADHEVIDLLFNVASAIKRRNKNLTIFMTGERASLNISEILSDCPSIDTILIGDADKISMEIINHINGQNDYVREFPKNRELLDLPWPIRDKNIMEEVGVAKIRTSWGCNAKCSFCIDVGIDGRWRGRSVEDSISEIEYIFSRYGVRRFSLRDNSFEDPGSSSKYRLAEFVRGIKEKQQKFYFDCSVRAESFQLNTDDTLVAELSKVGFYNVLIGFETGYQPHMKVFNKRASVQDNLEAFQLFSKHGIHVSPGFIMFHPYASVESLAANAKFLKAIGKSYSFRTFCSSLKLFSGVNLAEKLKRDGLLTGEFSYKDTVNYIYIERKIEELANVLNNVRYSGNAIRYGSTIDYSLSLLSRLNKNYADWKSIREFEDNVVYMSDKFGEEVQAFFSKCLDDISSNNPNGTQKYIHLFSELENKLSVSGIDKVIRDFIKRNVNNEELKYVLNLGPNLI